MSDITKAKQTLSELQAKRDRAVAAGHALGEERNAVAFGAHTGDDKARKRLNDINREMATHESELHSIDAAIAEANARMEPAYAAEAREANKAHAHALRSASKDLRAAGQSVDRALAAVVKASDEMRAVIDTIHTLGVSHPNHAQVSVFGERVIKTALMQPVWHRGFEAIAPAERRAFGPITDQWAARLEADSARRLGESEPKTAKQRETADA